MLRKVLAVVVFTYVTIRWTPGAYITETKNRNCQPTCCPGGFPKHTPFDCIKPEYNNKTGCPECPSEEHPTCKTPPECPTPDPPCPDPPLPNITVVPAYCIVTGGRLCYRCYVDQTVCHMGGIYIVGFC